MELTYNDGLLNRGRQPKLMITDGTHFIFQPVPSSVDGITNAIELDYHKNGKWSNSDWRIVGAEGVALARLTPDFETGRIIDGSTWTEVADSVCAILDRINEDEGMSVTLDEDGLQASIRNAFPKMAKRLDDAMRIPNPKGTLAQAFRDAMETKEDCG